MKKERKRGLDRNIRQCLTYVIKKDGPFRWNKILGFTKEEFLEHIKSEFEEGMDFSNYGKWVISFHIPKRCYNFKSLRDEDFYRFWSLKNITPRWLKDAQHQKKQIKKVELDKYGLWDILPTGNFASFLVDK
jgi:hypothetical protein